MTSNGNMPDAQADNVCPDCKGALVPTHWLASTGEYPVKEVVKVPGVRCKSCSYVRFEYDPHGNTPRR